MSGGSAGAAARSGGRERALRGALFGALGLLLLTPFVIIPGLVFPFVVGKALWSRALIEIVFALWAVLALMRPGYRPPRSRLLAWLGIGLGVSLLSAVFGASPEHSLWSDFERMLGVVDRAHWFALAVVLASVLRRSRDWRRLLGASAAAGAAMSCLVAALALDLDVPFYGALGEPGRVRFGGPFGNPAFLSAYVTVNAVLAMGFAARARAAGPRLGWLAAAAAQLGALVLAGSVGGVVALLGAAGFAALAFAWLSRGRGRTAAFAVLATLAVASAVLGVRFLDPGRTATVALDGVGWPGGGALRYIGGVHLDRPSVQSRLAAWEAGLKGFAARPALGWGPGNYVTVFGLFGSGYAATAEPHDLAHGKLVEVAATTGAAGLAAWLALWGLALAAPLRAARAMAPPECAFAVFAGAALAGHLVQVQFLFDTVAGTLPATLLLAFAARLETRVPFPRARLPGWLAAPLARFRRSSARRFRGAAKPVGRRTAVAATVALALWGLAVNRAILEAADTGNEIPARVAGEGIEAFPALAGVYRMSLFERLAADWPQLRAQDPARAAALLAFADREAAGAVRREPWNWRITHALARLYRAVAGTEPGYEAAAQRHLARARELAPAREVFPAPLAPPSGLTARVLPDERIELRWRPSPGAGYHQIGQIGQDAGPGARRPVLYAYGPGRTGFAAPAGPFRYRIKACRYPGDCSAWVRWP